MFAWFWRLLESFGFAQKNARILFLGLDNAGKTTLLHMLRDNKLIQHTPTHHPNSEELVMGGIKFHAFDLGGHAAARKLWREYFLAVDGIVFLIDAADGERMQEAKKELDALMLEPDLEQVPFLVLGNKVDAESAISELQLREVFGLHQTTGKGKVALHENTRPVEVFMCSIVERQGYGDGLRWLAQYV